MSELFLLISNPPHGDVDPKKAASCFGSTAAEIRMRMNYPASEIWFVDEHRESLRETARILMEAGAKLRLLKGKSLVALSQRFNLKRFAFAPDGLRCTVDQDKQLLIPYDWTATAVPCRPMETDHVVRLTPRQAANVGDRNKSLRQEAKTKVSDIKERTDNSFFDLYFIKLPKVRRLTIRPGTTDFSGLGDAMKPVVHENLRVLWERVEQQFEGAREDRRLVNLPEPRMPIVSGKGLRTHLETIDPTLREIESYDLVSRLAFLSRA